LNYPVYCHDVNNHNLQDIKQIDKTAYILQYADDTALIVHKKTTEKAVKKTSVTHKPHNDMETNT